MGTGCSTGTSRVEQLPAVLLCRDRCKFLEEALHHSYALADAHFAYIRSLRTVGPALRRFFEIFPADSTSHSGTDHDHSHNSVGDNYDYYSMQGRDYEVIMTSTIPAPPPTSWDYYFNLFDVDQYNSVVMKEKKQGETKSESEDQENIGAMEKTDQRSNWTRELEVWFQKASDSGLQVVEMLDTRKFRYHYHPTSGYWKMIEGIISQDDELLMSTHNLSSTLRKLCMWEHKLLGEVRAEEKLCVLLHIKKLKKQMVGDESSGSYSIRALYSKLKVAFHVIQNIFSTINNLTAEELWPHINQLIHRFFGMWELMSEIHRKQHQIVKAFCESKEANNLGVDKREILDDDHLDQVAAAGLVLEQVVQNWSLHFSKWIKAQRACINALNAWLCINYDHDQDHKPAGEGDHDQASTSTTCMPLMFLIINEWSNAMNRVSEEQVVASLNAFSATIVGVGDHQIMRHTGHDDDHHVFTYKVEKQGGSDGSQLCCCLEQVFMAMEKLATDWKQAYQAIIAGHALETYKSVAP